MIEFFIEHSTMNPDTEGYGAWLRQVAGDEACTISEIAYIFTTDEAVLKLNQDFLGHDYFTDVLCFDRSEGSDLKGDVFISLDRVRENARGLQIDFNVELRRVIVHGLLHMMGYEDKKDQDSAVMRKREDEALELFHVKH